MSKIVMRIYVSGSRQRVEGVKTLIENRGYDIYDMKIIESCAYNEENGHWILLHVNDAETRNSIAEFLDLNNLRQKVNWAF